MPFLSIFPALNFEVTEIGRGERMVYFIAKKIAQFLELKSSSKVNALYGGFVTWKALIKILFKQFSAREVWVIGTVSSGVRRAIAKQLPGIEQCHFDLFMRGAGNSLISPLPG